MTPTEKEMHARMLWALADKWHGTAREKSLRDEARACWPAIDKEITIDPDAPLMLGKEMLS